MNFATGLLLAATLALGAPSAIAADKPKPPTKMPLMERIAILKQTYPDLIYSVTNNSMRLMSNRTVVINDRNKKSHLQKKRNADIEDQLSQIYHLGKCYRGRKRNIDPGLIRSISFLRHAYGANHHQVKRTSVTIDWFGTPVRFSTRHGAAGALHRVLAELKTLPEKLQAVLKNPKRALDWGNVVDTDRLDVHAFGIAIDLNPKYSNNWRRPGARVGKLRRYQNRIHPEIITIFERHGFIWGGKWYRFSTGHFEYRPALIAIAQRALERGCEK